MAGLPARDIWINLGGLQDDDHLFADASRGVGTPAGPVGPEGMPAGDFTFLFAASNFGFDHGAYLLRVQGQFDHLIFISDPSPAYTQSYNSSTNVTDAVITFPAGQHVNMVVGLVGTKRQPGDNPGTGVLDYVLMRPTSPGATTYQPVGTLFDRNIAAMLAPLGGVRTLNPCAGNGDGQGCPVYVTDVLAPQLKINPNLPSQDKGNLPNQCDSYLLHWAGRRTPLMHAQSGAAADGLERDGIAFEYGIGAGNLTAGGGLWFNFCSWHSDDFVTNAFLAAAYGTDGTNPYTGPPGSSGSNPQPVGTDGKPAPLFPALRGPFIFEFANEVWNTQFPQTGRIGRLGAQAARSDATLNWDGLDMDDLGDQLIVLYRYVGQQLKRLADLGKAALGAAYAGKCFAALMGKQVDTVDAQHALDYFDHNFGAKSAKNYIDLLGCGWYINPKIPDGVSVADLTLDQVYGCGLVPQTGPNTYYPLIQAYGLAGAFYEGGLNYQVRGADLPSCALFRADPRAGRLQRQAIDADFAVGPLVQVLCDFQTVGDPWGNADSPTALDAPGAIKYRELVAARQAWQANPSNGASTDPPVPTATLSGVTVTPAAATVAAGGTLVIDGEVTGTNDPVNLLGYRADYGLVPGGRFAAPPPANADRTATVVAYSLQDRDFSAAASILIPATPGAPPPVGDPSFEAIRLGPDEPFRYRPAGGPAWAFADNAGITSASNPGGFAGLSPDNGSGTQYAFLQGSGSISQPLGPWAGGMVRVEFAAGQRLYPTSARQTASVRLGGVEVGSISPAPLDGDGNPGRQLVPCATPAFYLPPGGGMLALVGVPPAGQDVSLLIDDVRLVAVAPTPAPAADVALLFDQLGLAC